MNSRTSLTAQQLRADNGRLTRMLESVRVQLLAVRMLSTIGQSDEFIGELVAEISALSPRNPAPEVSP